MSHATTWFEDDSGIHYDVPPSATGALVLGRAGSVRGEPPAASIPIRESAASRTVSRRHAEIERSAVGWYLRDLGSTHGTRVNDRRVSREEPVLLRDYDVIFLGTYKLTFRDTASAATTILPVEDVLAAAQSPDAETNEPDPAEAQRALLRSRRYFLDAIEGEGLLRTFPLPPLPAGGAWKVGREAADGETDEFVVLRSDGPYLSVSRRHLEIRPLGPGLFEVVCLTDKGFRARGQSWKTGAKVEVTPEDQIAIGKLHLYVRDFQKDSPDAETPAERAIRAQSKPPAPAAPAPPPVPDPPITRGGDTRSHTKSVPRSDSRTGSFYATSDESAARLRRSSILVGATAILCASALSLVHMKMPADTPGPLASPPRAATDPIDHAAAARELLRLHGLGAYGLVRAALSEHAKSKDPGQMRAALDELEQARRLALEAADLAPESSDRARLLGEQFDHARRLLDLCGVPESPAWLPRPGSGAGPRPGGGAAPPTGDLAGELAQLASALHDAGADDRLQRKALLKAETIGATYKADPVARQAADGVHAYMQLLADERVKTPESYWARLHKHLESADPVKALADEAKSRPGTDVMLAAVAALPANVAKEVTGADAWPATEARARFVAELLALAGAYANGDAVAGRKSHSAAAGGAAAIATLTGAAPWSVRTRTEIDRMKWQLDLLDKLEKSADPCAGREDLARLAEDIIVRAAKAPLAKRVRTLVERCGGTGK